MFVFVSHLFLICLICSFHISPFQSISHVSPLEVPLVFVELRRQVYTRRCPASKEKTSLGRTDSRSPQTILAMDMEHDTNDIVFLEYLQYTLSVSTLFSHYVFGFVSNWFVVFMSTTQMSVCLMWTSHPGPSFSWSFTSRFSNEFKAFCQVLRVQRAEVGKLMDDIEWNFNSFNGMDFLRMERSRFGESKRPCRHANS